MGSRRETEKSKLIQEKCQNLLSQMLRDEDNKYCVDCDAKGPRWASWNLGVFLCIRCAGIHRNLGVHISRVKSVNLDSWTPEQVVSLQQMGNSRARAVYEAQLPDGFRRPQTDSALESFIRAKYEHKKYLAREWVAPPPPKVDWDKEIDEEIEKQKRKKKAASLSSAISAHNSTSDNKISIKAVPIPAPLPKPKGQSASPKSGSRLPPPSETNGTSNLDLLGLSSPVEAKEPPKSDFSGGDIFSGFLSGPPPVSETTAAPQKNQTTTSTISAVDALAKEEEDFFKQSVPNAAEKAKLTNDSILALYATQPTTWITNNFRPGQFVPQSNASMMPQSNAGMMPVMHPQMQPQHNFLMNGFGPQVGINQQQQHSAISGTMGGPLIPGANMTPAIPNASQQQPMFANFGMPNTAGGNQISLFGEPSQSQTAQTNPTGNLNQQIGNLNLGNVWH